MRMLLNLLLGLALIVVLGVIFGFWGYVFGFVALAIGLLQLVLKEHRAATGKSVGP